MCNQCVLYMAAAHGEVCPSCPCLLCMPWLQFFTKWRPKNALNTHSGSECCPVRLPINVCYIFEVIMPCDLRTWHETSYTTLLTWCWRDVQLVCCMMWRRWAVRSLLRSSCMQYVKSKVYGQCRVWKCLTSDINAWTEVWIRCFISKARGVNLWESDSSMCEDVKMWYYGIFQRHGLKYFVAELTYIKSSNFAAVICLCSK